MSAPAGNRLAILVACFNDGATLGATLDSLRDEPAAELVVVDDGSTDAATLQALETAEHAGVRVLRQENSGPSAAWTAGLGATSAPYVLAFSSDDTLVPGALATLADALDRNPDAAAAWGDMQSFGAATAYLPSTPALCPWHITYVNSGYGYPLFRRAVLEQTGGWQLRTGIEDWDLWMRVAASGAGGVHVRRPVLRYRRDSGGRLQGHLRAFDDSYDELRRRNGPLFGRRRETKRRSPAPPVLKALFPVVDRLPFCSRLLKVEICHGLTLLFWSAGLRQTFAIVADGIRFRLRASRWQSIV